jgi:hypothetical protein
MVSATAGEEAVAGSTAPAVSEAGSEAAAPPASEPVKTVESNAVEVMVPSCHPAKTARIVRMNKHLNRQSMNSMNKTRVFRITRTRVAAVLLAGGAGSRKVH